VSNIPNLCTHVIYAFATLDPTTYTMAVYDTWLDLTSGLGNYAKFVALKVVCKILSTPIM
jgi:chitinase